MPRAAGDGDYYEYVLLNKSTGRYDKDDIIKLPSVTAILKKTMAKEALIRFTHWQTVENISGMVDYLLNDRNIAPEEITDMMSDSVMLQEYLKENRLRPEDTMYDRADEGHAAHKYLEKVATFEGNDYRYFNEPAEDGYQEAIKAWAKQRQPIIQSSERRVRSLKHGFAGTMDLEYDGLRRTDLKTRGAGKDAYDSDFFQVDAYDIAAIEMGFPPAEERTVLICREDGTWDEYVSPYQPGIFLHNLAIFNELQRVKGVKK